MDSQRAFSDIDWQLFQLAWEPIQEGEVRAVAILRGDKQYLPLELANQLIDNCWAAIARYCLDQGYAYAKLYAQGEGEPVVFKVPAEFAQSHSSISPVAKWLNFPDEACLITAIRLIPFYLGSDRKLQFLETGQYQNIPCYKLGDLHIIYCGDGFAVVIQQQQSAHRDVIQFLQNRRFRHLEILHPESIITQQLSGLQDNEATHLIIQEPPKTLSYVMSVHVLDNQAGKISEATLRLMAEPSILGIYDTSDSDTNQRQSCNLFKPSTVWDAQIAIQRSGAISFYSTWSNVVAEIKEGSGNMKVLVQQEVQLQKLWYKLFLLSEWLERIVAFDEISVKAIQKLTVNAQKEFLNFIRASPTGSSLENALKEDLIQTSKIKNIFEAVVEQSRLVSNQAELFSRHQEASRLKEIVAHE